MKDIEKAPQINTLLLREPPLRLRLYVKILIVFCQIAQFIIWLISGINRKNFKHALAVLACLQVDAKQTVAKPK